jgi:hypothetical protein
VLCGGLEYFQASTVLRIGPHEMADLLRTVMPRLAISPAAVAGNADQM